jgi:hypothetical protein
VNCLAHVVSIPPLRLHARLERPLVCSRFSYDYILTTEHSPPWYCNHLQPILDRGSSIYPILPFQGAESLKPPNRLGVQAPRDLNAPHAQPLPKVQTPECCGTTSPFRHLSSICTAAHPSLGPSSEILTHTHHTMANGDLEISGDGARGVDGRDGYGYVGHAAQFGVNGTSTDLRFVR